MILFYFFSAADTDPLILTDTVTEKDNSKKIYFQLNYLFLFFLLRRLVFSKPFFSQKNEIRDPKQNRKRSKT